MLKGAITGYLDVAQLTLYAFFLFFGWLVFYLRREDKREGYPLESERSGHVRVQGFPGLPKPKRFLLENGRVITVPRVEQDARAILAAPAANWPGAPLQPLGNPMIDGVGPASYPDREDVPELTFDGEPLIVPMRSLVDTGVAIEDADPRGMIVVGLDGVVAGTVVDLWTDRAEPQIRYFELEVGTRRVLLPMPFARVDQMRRRISVRSITAAQFSTVPGLQSSDQVTKREEDRITAYYASGHLYAKPSRLGPLL